LSFDDIALVELSETCAAQVLTVPAAWD